MKILFLRMASYFNESNPHPENVMTPMDIAYLGAIAEKKNHITEFIDTETTTYSIPQLADQIKTGSYEICLIKAKSPSNRYVLELLQLCKQNAPNVKMIGIGHTFSTSPEVFLNSTSTMICTIHKEPELSFEAIIDQWDHLDLKKINGISFFNGSEVITNPDMHLADPLDQLPSPKYEWFLSKDYFSFYPSPFFLKKKMAFMLAARGCPKQCIYCSPTLRQTTGTGMRFHSVDRIVNDMKYLISRGVTIIQFRDDIFSLNKEFVTQLCQKMIYEKIKIKWMAQTHINHTDEKLLALMKQAGCITLGFGLESGSEEVLKRIKKFNDLNHARKMFKFCKKIGIQTVGFFLVGNPGESLEDIEKTKQLIHDLNPQLIQVALFTPYKGSAAYDLLTPEQKMKNENFHHYNKIHYNFSKIPTEVLQALPKKLYLSYIFRPKNFFRLCIELSVKVFVDPKITFRLVTKAFGFLFLRNLKQMVGATVQK